MTIRITFCLLLAWCSYELPAQFSILSPIDFQNQVSESFGSGISFYDFDKDGLDDITILDNQIGAKAFRNMGDSTFVLWRTFPSSSFLKSVSWVDFDNDGDADFFFTCYNCTNGMYRNDGDGNFAIINDQFFPAMPADYNTGHSWGDYDNDGFLDLYICIYNPSPTASHNLLYHNNGDGTFTEVSTDLGVSNGLKRSFQSVWTDFDMNGYKDLYVINDKNDLNAYYLQSSTGFSLASNQIGLNLAMDAMSESVADFDRDGDFDIYITDILTGNMLMQNTGGYFSNVAPEWGVDISGGWGWGALWLDADLDGDEDMFVTNKGALTNTADNRLFIQDNGIFTDSGNTLLDGSLQISFAVAKGDYNNDGRIDIAVTNNNPVSTHIFSNQFVDTGHYIKLGFRGTISNRDAIGTVYHVFHGEHHQMMQTMCGENYLGQNSQYSIVGLGDELQIDSLIVYWPSGWIDRLYNIPADQTLQVFEGQTFAVPVTSDTYQICPNGDEPIILRIDSTYQVLWSTGEDSSSILVNESGIYTAWITNSWGLTDTVEFEINTIQDPLEDLIIQSPLCNGGSNGFVQLVLLNEAESAVFWEGEAANVLIGNLPADEYAFNVEDEWGCVFDYAITIVEPDPIMLDLSSGDIACTGGNAEVESVVYGGTPPYEMDWNGLDSTAVASGSYVVSVTDVNGCAAEEILEVEEPQPLELIYIEQSVCFGDSLVPEWGVVGGTPPYDVTFLNTTFDDELPAGIYDVLISDANGCGLVTSFEIGEYDPISALSEVAVANDGDNGSILLDVTGGTPPYTFAWSNGGDSNPLEGIGQGYYQCVIQDVNNCLIATENIYVLDVFNQELPNTSNALFFPNPVMDDLNMMVPPVDSGERLVVFNSCGQIVVSQLITGPLCKINSAIWPAGMYLLRFSGMTYVIQKL